MIIGEKPSFKKILTEHFKQFESSPFLFVGSGMSRRYLGSETWEELLKKFCTLVNENYIKIRSQANGDLTEIASILANIYSDKWWGSDFKGDKDTYYAEHLTKKDSPLKIEISDYLKVMHEQAIQEFSSEIDLLRTSKIDGVITTNWDLFLDNIFNDFSVYVGQDDLFTSRNHGIAEIYKIHGCASQPNSLVLTKEDYELFRRKNPYLSSKLLTIFIEHPIVFLGYSLTDPHILEILEEIVHCFPQKKIESLKQNIIFVEWSPEVKEPILTESIILKTLPVKLIKASSYNEIFEVLSQIKRRIPAHIFRKIKDEIYELVITNDPKGKLYVKEPDALGLSDGQQEFVVGFGAINKFKKSDELSAQGLIGLTREDIVRDVIFDNGGYNPASIINEVFPKILKGGTRTPIYKYLENATLIDDDGQINTTDLHENIIEKIKLGIDDIRRSSPGETKRAGGIPQINEGVEQLYQATDFGLFLRMIVFIPPEIIDLAAFEKILKKHADDKLSAPEKSLFVKMVCLYDYIKYAKSKK
ncbi:SIR2 family protein [Aeromonas caviae]